MLLTGKQTDKCYQKHFLLVGHNDTIQQNKVPENVKLPVMGMERLSLLGVYNQMHHAYILL